MSNPITQIEKRHIELKASTAVGYVGFGVGMFCEDIGQIVVLAPTMKVAEDAFAKFTDGALFEKHRVIELVAIKQDDVEIV